MKIIFNLSLIMTSIWSSQTLAKVYSFDELLKLAKKNSIQIEIEKTKILELRAKLKELKADYYPKLSAVIGSERREARSEPEINETNLVGEVRLEYNLFKFGANSQKAKALVTLIDQHTKNFDYHTLKLRRELKEIFYELSYFIKYKRLLNDELEYNQKLYKQVSFKKRQGLVGAADTLEFKMRKANLTGLVLSSDAKIQKLSDEIKKLTLLEEIDFSIREDLPHEHFSVKLSDLKKSAKLKNNKLLRRQSKVSSALHALDGSRADRLPSLDLQGRYGKMRIDEQYANDSLEGVVGVFLTIPLFDGGANSSKVDLKKAQYARERLKLNRLQKELNLDVESRLLNMQNIHKNVDLAQESVENSEAYFKIVYSEYSRGIKNSLDLVSARNQILDFKTNFLKYKRDYLIAKLKLEEAAGANFDQ